MAKRKKREHISLSTLSEWFKKLLDMRLNQGKDGKPLMPKHLGARAYGITNHIWRLEEIVGLVS